MNQKLKKNEDEENESLISQQEGGSTADPD